MIRKTVLMITAASAFTVGAAGVSHAGAIEKACRASDRPAATASLCRCIGSVADRTLTGADQRQAAAFFKDPDKAQEIKMSNSRRHSEFWDRYKAFGAAAEQYCS